MPSTYQLPPTLKEDLERFKEETEKFKRGEISAVEYRSFRVPQGVYEQRTSGTFMLRVRFPGGVILPENLRTLAKVSRKYGNGILHVTTRQDVQIHSVPLDLVHPALVELAEGRLSTKGGGGNTVRNVCSCYKAGICPEELFDVTPYSVALTEFLIPDPISYRLPRKFKVAFSGCPKDCAGCVVNDVGFIATEKEGKPGFTVLVGGGMGAQSRVGELLEDYVTPESIHLVAEAVKRVFDKHGNRKDKHHARLRFLIEKIGIKAFKELYEKEYQALVEEKPSLPPLSPSTGRRLSLSRETESAEALDQESFERWLRVSVEPQKQKEFHLVHIPLVLGDIRHDTSIRLADIAEKYGEGVLRTTQFQNFTMRWVHETELVPVFKELRQLGLANPLPPVIRNLVACAGASTCRLGICLSRGLAQAILEELNNSTPDLTEAGDLRLHISGCPNSCGKHPVADIGLHGVARRRDSRLVPYYVIQLGGNFDRTRGEPRLAQGNYAVPAKNIPSVIRDFLKAFCESPHRGNFPSFLRDGALKTLEELVKKYSHVPPFEENKDFYYDWTAQVPFSLAGRGPGECGAGVFDLIEVDLKSAQEALERGELLSAITLAARSLLVTQGEEAKNEKEALTLFRKLFLEKKLVPEHLKELIDKAEEFLDSGKEGETLQVEAEKAGELVTTMRALYESMDSSLRFHPEKAEKVARKAQTASSEEIAEIKVDREEDFRGVVCPLNYVKTKLVLNTMKAGEVLAVLLDEEGKKNVPESIEKEGHTVLSIQEHGKSWRIVIRKET